MFTKLEFKDFRGFADLQLEGLQRVNLIVGRNNAGKTSFLEGITIAAAPDKITGMPKLLRPAEGNAAMRFFNILLRDQEGVESASLQLSGSNAHAVAIFRKSTAKRKTLAYGEERHVWNNNTLVLTAASQNSALSVAVVSVQQVPLDEIVKIFSAAVSRRGGEEKMDELFHKIDDRIRKVRVIPGEDGLHVMFDFNLSEMLPLSQVGQGIHRLVTIFSQLYSSGANICVIDEIENGIHHSTLEQVWAGIAAAAESLNIQVFATTHSYECIQAAHAAFSKRPTYDFGIVQLFRVESGVQGRVLDRKHIEAALAGDIDLR